MERVSVVHGKNPVILVAPHGFDDSYTDIMTEHAAIQCKGNAVINRGWERAKTVDVLNDKANCNNIKHALHDIVRDEFWNPIAAMEKRLSGKHSKIFVFHVHGCGNDICTKTKNSKLRVVLGYGKGPKGKSRPTCMKHSRNLFCYLLEKDGLWIPGVAEEGSRFAGWDTNNLLQMWRTSHQVIGVEAMHSEFTTATRKSKADAKVSGIHLGNLISKFLFTYNTAVPASYTAFGVKI